MSTPEARLAAMDYEHVDALEGALVASLQMLRDVRTWSGLTRPRRERLDQVIDRVIQTIQTHAGRAGRAGR